MITVKAFSSSPGGWKRVTLMLAFAALCFLPDRSIAQAYEIQQLLLDVEKLAQFKGILSDMKQGYGMLGQGYGSVKKIAQGSFNLHEAFLDGLLTVNPNVKKYKRVADIIRAESSILSEYKSAYKSAKNSGTFSIQELGYLGNVYGKISAKALHNLDDLIMVITASKLRMSDDERLREIDSIYEDVTDKLSFLRHFNGQAAVLNRQRQNEHNQTQTIKNFYQP